jgi:hypothetical protein
MIQIGGKSTMPFSDKKTISQYFSKNYRAGRGFGVGVSEYNLETKGHSQRLSLVFRPLIYMKMHLLVEIISRA